MTSLSARRCFPHELDNAAAQRLLVRVLAVATFVTIAHQADWVWLRYMTSEAILRASHALGLTTSRVSFDTVRIQDHQYCFVTSCTFIDVLFGVIPLVWSSNRSLRGNALVVALWLQGLFVFNVVRLQLSLVLIVAGIPWMLAHDVLSGLAYFGVWVALGGIGVLVRDIGQRSRRDAT